jgi:LacI family transcriptional regulator
MLSNQQVEGFLITPCKGMEEEVQRLIDQNKPVVMMDRYFDGMDTPYVIVDNEAGINAGLEHLFNKSYRKIAFITADLDQIQMKERELAFEKFMQAHNLNDSYILKLSYAIKPEDAITQISSFLHQNPDLDAVFFATNYLGVYGLEAIKTMNISIPDELAVLCFDDHDIFRLYTPGITVVKQPIHSIAVTAIQMLMKQFQEQQLSPEELFVTKEPELIVRAST